jgi:Uma2 family endonuclease
VIGPASGFSVTPGLFARVLFRSAGLSRRSGGGYDPEDRMPETKLAMEEATDRYRITVEQYHRMGETGIIPDDARVELLDGEIVEMSAVGSPHGGTVKRLTVLFAPLFDRAIPCVQDPVVLPPRDEPEPDFMLLCPRADTYCAGHPGAADVLLLVEVADTSLPRDRTRKGRIYARHGIREYWIVDLPGDRIEVRRRPEGDVWGETFLAHRGDEIAPTAFPEFCVAVDAVLPPPASG